MLYPFNNRHSNIYKGQILQNNYSKVISSFGFRNRGKKNQGGFNLAIFKTLRCNVKLTISSLFFVNHVKLKSNFHLIIKNCIKKYILVGVQRVAFQCPPGGSPGYKIRIFSHNLLPLVPSDPYEGRSPVTHMRYMSTSGALIWLFY